MLNFNAPILTRIDRSYWIFSLKYPPFSEMIIECRLKARSVRARAFNAREIKRSFFFSGGSHYARWHS